MAELFKEEVENHSYYNPKGPKAPVAWYGGKAYYAKWIISHFPHHRVYIEPFGGAGNILLRKHPSEVEIYNDLDGRIVNFFDVLRDKAQFVELVRLASLTPYSRDQFKRLAEEPEPSDTVDRAWWFFVRCRQAVGGIGMSKLTPSSWAISTRTRRMMAEPVSKYLSSIDGLEDVASRLRTVVVESMDAIKVMKKYDKDDVFYYCDPPYVPETRHGRQAKTYGCEMTHDEHIELLQLVCSLNAKVMISGYDSDLYSECLKGWSIEKMSGKAHMANSGQGRTEVLWMNW